MSDGTYYVHCRACDWYKEFDEGGYRQETSLEESAKKRLAGHISQQGCSHEDHEYGPVDERFEEVLEVKATVTATFHFPLDTDSPATAIHDLAGRGTGLRNVDNIVLDQVYKMERY